MIRCLVIHHSISPHGTPLRREQRIAATEIALGRGAACDLHLPDERVALRHAVIRRDDLGRLAISGEGDALLSADGFMAREAALAAGGVIGIGPYRLTVSPAEDPHDLVLALDVPVAADTKSTPAARDAADVPHPWLTKRRLGIALALLILVAGFALPLAGRSVPALEALAGNWLSPGALDTAHTRIAGNCSACHTNAFAAVADTACTECHREARRHWPADLAGAPKEAHRCIDCHAMHPGKAAATRGDDRACTGCHAGLEGDIARIGNFGHAHPEFQLSLLRGKGIERVSQAAPLPPERNGLRFPHELHLAAKGVSSPEGDTVLRCADCHRPEPGGAGFQPVDMAQGCQQSRCHTLRYPEPVLGVIPHGSERLPVDHLRRHFLAELAALPPAEFRTRCRAETTPGSGPGTAGASGAIDQARRCAERLALSFAGGNLFHTSGDGQVCGLCHGIRRTENASTPWRVTPVRMTRDWHAGARFPHQRHATQACSDCHRKEKSESADDIAMPGIAVCRDCHDDRSGGRRIGTPCMACHAYHRVQ